MKKFPILFLLTAILTLGMMSCDDGLSDGERKVIENDLARIIYNHNIDQRAENVMEYLTEAIEASCDQAHQNTQAKIDDRNATSALLGGNMFDMGELFGTSTNRIMANNYYKYIDYVNDKIDDAADDAETIVKIIKAHPDVLKSFFSDETSISLSVFRNIDGVPSSITSAQFARYKNLDQDKGNRSQWGELLMGTVKQPHYSPVALLCALVTRIERLKYPAPVYAVFKDYDDEIGWEVGYDTSQAYFITFEENGDVLEYEYVPVDYHEAYIKSENNELRRK